MALTLLKGVIVLAIVTGTLAGPVRYDDDLEPTTQCATTCDLTETAKYTPGQTYEYAYEADIRTSIPGATEEESSLRLAAQVQLEALTPCEMAIKLTDVSLEDGNPKNGGFQFVEGALQFKRALQENPLRFAFHNGKIESVCPERNEETWVLNVKRGIISHIQNTMADTGSNTRLRETDINGDCEVSYEVVKQGWSSNTVKKSADLIGCVGRQSFDTVFQGTPYRVPSRLQSLPLLKSSHECEQTLGKEGHVTAVSCEESHVFRPFSKDNKGAMTKIVSKLTLKGTTSATRIQEGTVSKRLPLIFDSRAGPIEQEQSRREVKGILQKLCTQTQEDIRPETPELYHSLIKKLRKLDTDSLNAIHRSVADGRMCEKAEKYVRDAIPVLGSPAAVAFIKDLVLSGEVKDTELDVWMTSLAFISKPSISMLEAVKPLVQMTTPNRKVALAVSSLVHAYCRENEECGEESVVKAIVNEFRKNLMYSCKSENEEEYEKVMMSLKAIGNTGHAESAVDSLNSCMTSAENSMEVRIAAVSAFRRMACTAEKYELMRMFEDTTVDSELRIAAYLAMMICPTPDILNRVRASLEKEEINQVGSFVWTHLTNLVETSCPLKQEIREILENADLKTEFNMDKRKFSRNIEWSLFSELINTGVVAESNVIWSTKSFIPRSANLNLTLDMFGESVNLLELGGRAEGLDSIIEKIFNKEKNTVERQKRDVIRPAAIGKLDKQYKPEGPDSPQGSYFIRIFGNEIRYDDFRGLDMQSLKDKFNFLNWLMDLSQEHDFDFTKSISFLDTTMCIPTIAGLPLTLSVDGTAVVNVKVKGKLDLKNLGIAPRSVDIQGTLAPSAAVEITGEMGVDAFVARTGLRRTTTLHTSTMADGKIELKEGKIFNMDINMPRDKIELFDAKSKFYIHYRGEDREQTMPSVARISKEKCLGGNLVRAVGMEVCAKGTMPSLKSDMWWMPVFGPMEASIIINKKDTFTGMHFEAKFLEDRVMREEGAEVTDIMKVSFNTPGSRYDREFTVDFTLNRDRRAVQLNMKTPWKKADLTGSLVNEDDLKRLTARAIVDDEKEYALTAEVQVEETKYNTQYRPVIELTVPTRSLGRLDGEIIYRAGKKIDIDLNLKEVTRTPMSVKGSILVKKKGLRHDASLSVKVPRFSGEIEGFLERSPETGASIDSRMQVNYQIDNGARESFTINKKLSKTNTGDLDEYSLNGGVSSSRWPEYNSDMQMTLSKTGKKSMSLSLEGGLGETSNKRLTLTASATDNSKNKKKDYEGFLRFKLPVMNMAYELSAQHMNTNNELKTKGSVKYGQRQEAVLDVHMEKDTSGPLRLNADATLHYPGREFSYVHSIEEKNPSEYHHDLELTLAKYQKIGITSVYKMKPRHELTATLNLPSLKPIMIEGHLNPQISNLQSHVLVRYSDQKWGGDATILYNMGKKDGNMRAGFDIIYPSRHIKAEADATRSGKTITGRIEALWDAERDTSKKVDINGEVLLNAASPKIQLKTTWPQNYIEITANGKYDKKGWWAVERDMEGAITIKSSIEPMEDISIMFSHDQKDEMVKTHVESSWAPGKKIDGDFLLNKNKGWSNIDSTVTVNTPFNGYRNIQGKVSYKLQGVAIEGKAMAKWEAKEMSVDMSGYANMKKHDMKGSISISSPFKGFKQMSIDGSHTDDGETYNSILTANWGPSKTAGVAFNMKHGRQGWYVSNSGDFAITTPIPEYENNKIIWNHNNDEKSIKSHAEAEISGGKSIFDLDANHKSNRRQRVIDMSATLRTPFKAARDMRLNFNHENEKNSWENVKTSGLVQWAPGKVIQVENTVGYTAASSVTKNMKITTPFRGYELITIAVDSRINGDTFTSHKEIKWGNNKKITIDGSMTRKEYEVDAELRFTSPFEKMERIVFMTSNKKENKMWASSMSFDYAPEKKIELTTKIGLTANKKIFVNLVSPCPYIKDFLIDIDHTGELRDFSTKAEFKLEPIVEPISAVIKVDTSSLKNIKAKVNIQTPFRNARSIRALVSHKKAGPTGYKTDISIEMPRHKITASHDLTMASIWDYSCHSEAEYNREKQIELDVSWKWDSKVVAEVNVKPYFTTVSSAGISVNHEGKLNDFRNGATIEWDNKKIIGSAEFKLEPENMVAKVKIDTPFKPLKDFEIDIKHEGDISQFQNDASVAVNGKRSSFSSEASYSGKQASGKMEFTIPYDNKYIPRTMMLTFNHQGKLKNFRNTASLEWGSKRYGANSEYSLKGTNMRGSVTVQVPEDYSIIVNHKGEFSDFSNSLEIRLGGKEINGNSAYKLDGSHMEASASIRTPYEKLPYLSGEISHDGGLDNFKTDASVKTPFETLKSAEMSVSHNGHLHEYQNSMSLTIDGRKIAGNTRFSKISENIDASGSLETPFEDYRRFGYTLNHQGGIKEFSTTAGIETPFKRFKRSSLNINHKGSLKNFDSSARVETSYPGFESAAVSAKHITNRQGFKSSGSIETPFRHYKKMEGSVNHRGDWRDFSTSVNAETSIPGYETFAATVSHSCDDRKSDTSASVKTPFRGFEKFDVGVNHEGTRKEFVTSGHVKTSLDGYERFGFNMNHKADASGIDSSATVETPIRGYERFMASLQHSGNRQNFRTSAGVETAIPGYSKFGMNVNHKGDLRDFETSGSIETPIRGYDRFSGNMKHKGSLNDFESSGSIETPIRGYERFGANMQHSGSLSNFQSSASVETPIPGYDRFGMNVNHRGSLSDFETSGTVETPISGYERFSGNLKHKGTLRNFETSGGLETPIRGYDRFSGTMKHRGTLGDIETSASLETPIRGFRTISGNFKHQGDMDDFETSAGFESQKHKLSGKMKHRGDFADFETSASAESSFPGYERFSGNLKHKGGLRQFETVGSVETSNQKYDRFAVNINHNAKRGIASTGKIETPIRGYDNFNWDISHRGNKKGFSTSAKLNTPIRGYERFGVNVKHQGSDWNDFTTHIKAKSPIRGYETFGARINHQGDLSDFKTSAKINTPFDEVPTINVNVNHQGDRSTFNSGGSVEWNGKTIEGSAAMRTSGGWWKQHDHTATVSLKTPYDKVKNAGLKFEHNGGSGAWHGKLQGSLNDKTHVDADYSIDTGDRKTLDINVREPRPVTFNVDANKKGITAAVNWDPSKQDSSVRLEAGLKNAADEKELKAKIELPTRTIGVVASLDRSSPDKWAHKAEIQWDAAPNKKFGYEVEMSRSSRGRQEIHDGMVKFSSPRINFEVSGNNVMVPGKRYTTELVLQTKERLAIKHELTTNWPAFREQITISHPRFQRDAVITTEGTIDLEKYILDGKIGLRYEAESIDFTGKIADESSSSSKHYVAAMTLRHPNSQLDFSYSGAVQSGEELHTVNSEMNFLCSHDREMKTFALRTEINKLREEIKLEWENPIIGDLSATGRRTYADHEAGIHRFEATGAYKGRSGRVDMELDRSDPSAELKITDHRDNILHLYGKYLNPNHLSLKAYHTARGEDVNDAEIALKLTDGRLLHARAFLRPDIIDDVKGLMKGSYDFKELEKIKAEISEEWEMKKPALMAALTPVSDAASAVHEDLAGTWKPIAADLRKMYRNNDFYIADIYNTAADVCEAISDKLEEVAEKVCDVMKDVKGSLAAIASAMAERMEKARREFQMVAGMFISGVDIRMREIAADLKTKMCDKWEETKEWARKTTPWIGESIEKARSKYNAWSEGACDWVKDKMDMIRNHHSVQDVVAKVTGARATLNRWRDSMSNRMDNIKDRYNSMVDSAKDKWTEAQKHPHVKKAVDMAKSAWDNSQWAVKYIELEDKARQAYDWVKDQSLETAKDKAMEWTKNYLQLDKTRFTVWDPQEGDFQAEIYLPVTLRDLQTLPKVDLKKLKLYVVRARNLINKYMPENIYVWDYYYTYMPSADYTNWLPPFKAHAIVAGKQHYMTFDKHFYEFEGQCSYLLARDFIDGKFAVIVNYESGRKTMTVMIGNKQVEILPGYKVLLDGQRVEMPQHIDKATITREGSAVVVRSNHGVTVSCLLPRDRCTVDVSGWYFAKTAGMLGTYNNEPADDFTGADGSRVRSPEELADSWTVGRTCNTVNSATIVDATPDNHRYRLCARYFKDESSPFRPCFKQVDPESFLKMCLNELPTNLNRLEKEEDICDVASHYVAECKSAHVPLRVPPMCVSCTLPDGSLQAMGEDRKLEGDAVPESADIVVVMSHGSCNEELKPDMPSLITNINQALKEAGFKDNRFALVGYGGDRYSKPHPHTMQGEIFGDQSKFSLALDNFDYEDTVEEDSLAALRYVSTELAFRPAVSKSVILIPCAKCVEKVALYSEVQELMLRRDLALHVLMEHEFRVKAKSPKTSFIFGVDSESMFTEKDARKLRGDSELRDFVIMPKDICVALSEETDGSVFNVNKMKTGKVAVQKKFRYVFSLMVAEKAEPADCQVCDCVADDADMGMSVCRPCEIRSPIYKYLPNFEDDDEEEESAENAVMKSSSEEENKPIKDPIKIRPPKKTRNQKLKEKKARLAAQKLRKLRILKRKNKKASQ